jgi:hypothetical protein
MSAPQPAAVPRQIAWRSRGHSHGPITRLVSPHQGGQYIKPFVFLDYFDSDPAQAPTFGFHPHSDIATLTLIWSGQAFYKETTDREGGWDQKLKASVEAAGPSFTGPMTNPDKPWHYDYAPPSAATTSK